MPDPKKLDNLTPDEVAALPLAEVREYLAALREREARLERRLQSLPASSPKSIEDTACTLGLSTAAVKRIQQLALLKLRHQHPDLKTLLNHS